MKIHPQIHYSSFKSESKVKWKVKGVNVVKFDFCVEGLILDIVCFL